MAIKLSTALEYIEHSGWGSNSPVLGKRAVAEAIVEIENVRKWRWMQGPATTLTIVQDQEYVDLPADFRDMISASATEGLQGRFFFVDIGEILRLRTYQQSDSSTTYRGAIEWADSPNPNGGPQVPRLAIYPIPAATLTDWLKIIYRKTVAIPDTDDDYVPMPEFMDPLFYQVLDAVTKGWAFDDAVERGARPGRSRQQRLAEILSGPTFMHAVARDRTSQPLFGLVRNAAVPRRVLAPLTLANQVSPPG